MVNFLTSWGFSDAVYLVPLGISTASTRISPDGTVAVSEAGFASELGSEFPAASPPVLTEPMIWLKESLLTLLFVFWLALALTDGATVVVDVVVELDLHPLNASAITTMIGAKRMTNKTLRR